SSIMPLLTNLENHFTQYTFDQVVNLTSKYAISFFQLFTKDFNRIRQKSPILYRWVMNAVRYEGYRW
ncbi:replication initiation protein, partial [Enterococcus faecium]